MSHHAETPLRHPSSQAFCFKGDNGGGAGNRTRVREPSLPALSRA